MSLVPDSCVLKNSVLGLRKKLYYIEKYDSLHHDSSKVYGLMSQYIISQQIAKIGFPYA